MSFSKSNFLKISSQLYIWNTLNVINILSAYICTEGVCATPCHSDQNISQMDHPHIFVTPTPPFATACTNLPDDLFYLGDFGIDSCKIPHNLRRDLLMVCCHRWCLLCSPIPLPLRACPWSMLIIPCKNIFRGWLWALWGYHIPPSSQGKDMSTKSWRYPKQDFPHTLWWFGCHWDVNDWIFVCNPTTEVLVVLTLRL
jgi:hypothetical protein